MKSGSVSGAAFHLWWLSRNLVGSADIIFECRFWMLEGWLCGLPLHGLLLRLSRLKRGTRGFAAQTAAFLHA